MNAEDVSCDDDSESENELRSPTVEDTRREVEHPAEWHLRRVILMIGDHPDRPGLRETPTRVVKSWKELFAGYKMDAGRILKVFPEVGCDEMVVVKDIEFYSTCEHHMLPFYGTAHVGYLPNGKEIVGLSKLPRLVECFARRLQVQERIGKQVADALMEHLKPKGAGVVIEAKHFCIACRGVNKQNSVAVTSTMRGAFHDDARTRSEFLKLIGN